MDLIEDKILDETVDIVKDWDKDDNLVVNVEIVELIVK